MRGEFLSSGARRLVMRDRVSLWRPQSLLLLCLATLLTLGHSVNAQSCDPDADATYTAAVLEYSPALGVTLENVEERFRQNVQNYVAYAKEAKRQGAEIVAFPECGLATLELPRLPDSSPAVALLVPPVGSNPCIEADVQHSQELRDLSCAARDSAIYIVVNLPELERCFPTLSFCPECPGFDVRSVRSGIVACNMDGKRYFNTDVAFDRKGTIVARYRKYNLFGEAGFVPPAEPPLEYFDADFGVRFGLFTCFDIMFETPAVTLVTEAGVTDVIFPTAWFSELPFLTAVQAQASWAWVLDVNLLGAGYNLPEVGSTGTGLYAGRRGKVVATMERERTNKLLVGRLPNRNACGYNSTAATQLSGRIVVLSRNADLPIPKPKQPDPPLKCSDALTATDVEIPSLYQCHLQSLLALKDERRLINPETGEEADDAAETVKYELHFQRTPDDDEAEVRADEEEFKEAVKPRPDGEASLIYGPRYRQYIQDVILRGMRKLQDKSDFTSTEEESEFDTVTADEDDEAQEYRIEQMEGEFNLFEENKQEDESEEKGDIPTLEDTVDAMRDGLASSLGSQAVGRQDELDDFIMHEHESEMEMEKLHEMETPPLNDTLQAMMDQEDGEFVHEIIDELQEEEKEIEEKEEEPVLQELFDKHEGEEQAEEEIPKEISDEIGKDQEEEIEGSVEIEEGEKSLPAIDSAAPVCQCVGASSLHEPSDEPSLEPSVKKSVKKLPPAKKPISPVAAPGGESASSRGWRGALIGEDDGYLYLKTEDLSNYVTLLLPSTDPEIAVQENSSFNLCHEGFCCHFQIVMTVVDSGGMASFQTEHRQPASPGNEQSHCAGCTAEEEPHDNLFEAAEVSLVKSGKRSAIGGPLAKHFVVMGGETEDYDDTEEDYDDDDDDEDDDEEEDEDDVDLEEMEPTEDENDDDEEVQMDTSAEFSIDTVVLQASGIGHWQSSIGKVNDTEVVVLADMEPSVDAIRAKFIADKREELEEEVGEMEAALAEPESFAPDSEIEEHIREIHQTAVEHLDEVEHKLEQMHEMVEDHLMMDEEQPTEEHEQPCIKAPEERAEEPKESSVEAPEEMVEEHEELPIKALPILLPRGGQRYFYRAVVFNGLRTFDGITDGGLQVCAVIPCTGTSMDTCGKLHQEEAALELASFRLVRISGRFSRVRSLPLPSTLDGALMPLPAHAFSLTATVRRKETDIVMETHKPVSFLTFGIYNRNFAIDPERIASIG